MGEHFERKRKSHVEQTLMWWRKTFSFKMLVFRTIMAHCREISWGHFARDIGGPVRMMPNDLGSLILEHTCIIFFRAIRYIC